MSERLPEAPGDLDPSQQEQYRRIEAAKAELGLFVDNPAQDELASLYHVELPEAGEADRLPLMQDTAGKYWDFRKGAERQSTEWDVEGELGEEGSETWNTVFEAATKLNQVESSKPENTRPSYLVVLGGANRSPFDRLRYGLESVEDFGVLVYVGSSRKLPDAEREKAKDYAPGAETEYDLGCGAIETKLGARLVSQDRTVRNGDTWAWSEYEFEVEQEGPDGEKRMVKKTAIALNTPVEIHTEEDKARRANTYDNYRFLAQMAEFDEHPDATVVAVTTGFYVPGQHLPAVQELTLPYGVQVETIGHSAGYTGVQRKPSQLLQEDKAGIDAAGRLAAAIAAEEARLLASLEVQQSPEV